MPAFLDAAHQVLKEAESPMSCEEITRQALARNLLTTRGATPEKTMASSLYMDVKEKGAASRFIQVSANRFALNDQLSSRTLLEPKAIANQLLSKSVRTKRNLGVNKASSVHELLDQEIGSILAFLRGKSEQSPTSEKICDWVNLCYTLGLYSEGAELFSLADVLEVNDWYFKRTQKLARLCAMKVRL